MATMAYQVDVERPLSSSTEPWYRKFYDVFDYPANKCLHELFGEQADRTPDRPCIADPRRNTSYTFAEVDRLTDEIAEWLVSRGCGPDKVVGIYMDRRAEYFLAYVAILKAGGAYMPLEPAYPKDLLLNVLDDARPVAVLASAELAQNIPTHVTAFVLDGDDWVARVERCVRQAQAAGKPTSARRPSQPDDLAMVTYSAGMRPSPDNLAYVVYSSGTTGHPKGIQCPHRGAVHSYWWRYVNMPFEEGERVACNVFFVWEVLRAPLQGYPSYVIPDDVIYDPQALVRFLREHEITRVLFTPSLLSTVLDAVPDRELRDSLPHLRIVWLCGEVVTVNLRNRFVSTLRHVRLLNLYSISECHDVAVLDLSAYTPEDSDQRFTPVGRVFPNVVVALLDDDGNVVPQGEFGEICVGGVTLARGYLNQPDLNAQRFIASDVIAADAHNREVPLGAEEEDYRAAYWRRMYRTGDMGRFLADGNLEVVGRCDFMVKIRGYSVNVGAIEAALTVSPFVKSTAVLAEGDEGTSKRLVAYVVLEEEAPSATAISASMGTEDLIASATSVAACFSQARGAVDEVEARLEGEGGKTDPEAGAARQALVSHMQTLLKSRLPFYAVPAHFVQLKALPIFQASGKLNRRGLPSVAEAREMGTLLVGTKSNSAAPTSTEEKRISALWGLVLDSEDGEQYGIDDSFFDVGGHSLTASRLRANLNSVFSVELAVKDVFTHPTIREQAQLIASLQAAAPGTSAAEIIADERVRLAQEELKAIRDDARMLDAGIRPHTWQPRRVLLTGATGWVGAFLLYEFLRQCPTSEIVCLVRPGAKPGSAREKLIKNLEATGLLPYVRKDLVGGLGGSRVTVYEGDLSKEMLGLSAGEFTTLGHSLALVVHAAAHVNLVLPYRELAPANVGGTSELLRLCCVRPTPFYFISSNAVFPTDGSTAVWQEYDRLDHLERLGSGYAQSKWAAEQRIKIARQRGVPATVFRLGNMGGDTVNGLWNKNDSVLHVLTACAAVGAVPDLDWDVEMLPVNWVAQMIVRLSLEPNTRNRVYHIAQPRDQCPSLHSIAAWMRSAGFKLDTCDYAEWCARVEALGTHELSAALPSYTSGNYVQDLSVFMDSKNFRKVLKITGAIKDAPPTCDEALFKWYLKKMQESGVIASPAPAPTEQGDATPQEALSVPA